MVFVPDLENALRHFFLAVGALLLVGKQTPCVEVVHEMTPGPALVPCVATLDDPIDLIMLIDNDSHRVSAEGHWRSLRFRRLRLLLLELVGNSMLELLVDLVFCQRFVQGLGDCTCGRLFLVWQQVFRRCLRLSLGGKFFIFLSSCLALYWCGQRVRLGIFIYS